MNLPVRATIEEIGLSKVAKEMGAPVSSVHRWKEADALPIWRRRDFETAAQKLLSEKGAQPT